MRAFKNVHDALFPPSQVWFCRLLFSFCLDLCRYLFVWSGGLALSGEIALGFFVSLVAAVFVPNFITLLETHLVGTRTKYDDSYR